MNTKKLLSMTMTAALAATACFVPVSADEAETVMLKIGTSSYAIPIDVDYVIGEMTAEDLADNQIGYYVSEENPVDFDVYQFPKSGEEAASLYEYVVYEAGTYGVEGIAEDSAVNYGDLAVYSYEADEEFEGEMFTTENYVFEEGEDYFELVFWMDQDKKDEQLAYIEGIIGGITKVETMKLGTSGLSIYAPGYEMGELDDSEDLVGYYYSESSTMDFDVYQWAKEGQTLAEAIAEEAEGKEITVASVNGIEVQSYKDVEVDEDKEYNTVTCIMEDGDDFVEVVFWLDGDSAEWEATLILNTLSR